MIRILREGSVAGRLSDETFLRRVDHALRARGMGELSALLSDLPPGEPSNALGRLSRAWSRYAARLRAPRLPWLVLPRGPRTVFTIGRSPESDLPIADITVSWRHAELRRTGQAWVLVDLGSRNGTWVNGWRADCGFALQPGDWVRFGRSAFRIADGA